VKDLVDIADVRYAVVEVPRIEGGCDRFVVAYPNENCLYDLIASPASLRTISPLARRQQRLLRLMP
jgi:hypothetical protein